MLQTLISNRWNLVITGSCILLIAGFILLFYLAPEARLGPKQPISFSHRVHAGVKQIQCRFCHPYVDRSPHPGIAPVEKCLYCHKYIIAGHPEIIKEHHYFNTGTPVPWKKVFYVPEHVLFKHQRHIKKEIACDTCHGDIEAMDRIRGVSFEMGFCVACHQENKGPLDCWLACHS